MSLPYTSQESAAAHAEWKASCGHHSIAAACNIPLNKVKEACPKLTGWMSPTMVSQTLEKLGKCPRCYKENKTMNQPPDHIVAICRLQYEGRWMEPGVPMAARYKETHYVAIVGGALVMDTTHDTNILLPWERWKSWADEYTATRPRKSTGWHFSGIWLPNDH